MEHPQRRNGDSGIAAFGAALVKYWPILGAIAFIIWYSSAISSQVAASTAAQERIEQKIDQLPTRTEFQLLDGRIGRLEKRLDRDDVAVAPDTAITSPTEPRRK